MQGGHRDGLTATQRTPRTAAAPLRGSAAPLSFPPSARAPPAAPARSPVAASRLGGGGAAMAPSACGRVAAVSCLVLCASLLLPRAFVSRGGGRTEPGAAPPEGKSPLRAAEARTGLPALPGRCGAAAARQALGGLCLSPSPRCARPFAFTERDFRCCRSRFVSPL